MSEETPKGPFTLSHPVHPGELLKKDILPFFDCTFDEAAAALRLTSIRLKQIVEGREPIRPYLALKLERAFGCDPELLLKMQVAFDLSYHREVHADAVAAIQPISKKTGLSGNQEETS